MVCSTLSGTLTCVTSRVGQDSHSTGSELNSTLNHLNQIADLGIWGPATVVFPAWFDQGSNKRAPSGAEGPREGRVALWRRSPQTPLDRANKTEKPRPREHNRSPSAGLRVSYGCFPLPSPPPNIPYAHQTTGGAQRIAKPHSSQTTRNTDTRHHHVLPVRPRLALPTTPGADGDRRQLGLLGPAGLPSRQNTQRALCGELHVALQRGEAEA